MVHMTIPDEPQRLYPTPPYLPPMPVDPGIPPKEARPSIRERGLIIWILVLTIVGMININAGSDSSSVYDEAYRGALDAQSQIDFNFDGTTGSIYRTEVSAIKVNDGTVVFSVVTNSGPRTVSFFDLRFSGYMDSQKVGYISGPQNLRPGESTVVAVLVEKDKNFDVQPVLFDYLVSADGQEYELNLNDFDGDISMKTVNEAYEGLALADYERYVSQKGIE